MKEKIIEMDDPFVEPIKEQPTIEFKTIMNEAFIEAFVEHFNQVEQKYEQSMEAAQEEQDRIEQQNLNKIWGHIGPRIP